MIRAFALLLPVVSLCCTACDNRTRDGVRYDQIEANLTKEADTQPWSEAKTLWRSEHEQQPISW